MRLKPSFEARPNGKPPLRQHMASIGTCGLCNAQNATLRASHIVPEFFYKRVYTKSHKFTAVPLDAEERLAVEQKGYREDLLCQACETKLSKWEGKLSQLTNDLISGFFTTCSASHISSVICLTGVDYASLKMAVLSIFWRMSLASHPIFKSYELGPYEKQFRIILDQDRVPSIEEFPVLVAKGLLQGQFHPGILFPVGRGRYDDLIMQSVVLNGIVFDCVMTSTRKIPDEILAFSLQPGGRVLVPNRRYEELGMNVHEFSQRIKGADVKHFFARYA